MGNNRSYISVGAMCRDGLLRFDSKGTLYSCINLSYRAVVKQSGKVLHIHSSSHYPSHGLDCTHRIKRGFTINIRKTRLFPACRQAGAYFSSCRETKCPSAGMRRGNLNNIHLFYFNRTTLISNLNVKTISKYIMIFHNYLTLQGLEETFIKIKICIQNI